MCLFKKKCQVADSAFFIPHHTTIKAKNISGYTFYLFTIHFASSLKGGVGEKNSLKPTVDIQKAPLKNYNKFETAIKIS